MSVLSQKLEEASKLFQAHNFKKSLEAYQECIRFAQRTEEEPSVIHNIQSTKGTLEYILGDFDTALSTLNSVLHKDPCHFLSLLRRSQVYKKKNKLGRALKDLQKIFVFCPDNLQISAFKAEIEHTLLKQGSTIQTLSDSDDDDIASQEQDEAQTLNFMNLKKIDRKSSDLTSIQHRKSRVTISGDTLFEYQGEQQPAEVEAQPIKSSEQISDKAIRTLKQIELDDQTSDQPQTIKINVCAPKKPKRSILKNKGISIFIAEEDILQKKQKYEGRKSRLLQMLKNIDGKMVHSAETEHEDGSNREVQFRKSVSITSPLELFYDPSASAPNKSAFCPGLSKRKSCLKRQSFDGPDPKMTPKRSSKFETLAMDQVDGKLIHTKHKRNSIDNREAIQENAHSDSDNEASSHNIFGDSNFVMTEEMKQKLGLNNERESRASRASKGGESEDNDSNGTPMRLKKKQSILKKNSSMRMTEKRDSAVKESSPDESEPKLRNKKSVMFNCTM